MPREDAEMRIDEEEELLESEVPRARLNPKKPPVEGNKNMEILDMPSAGLGVLLQGRGIGGQRGIELLDEQERTHDSHCRFRLRFHDTEKRREAGIVRQERHVVNEKVPQHTPVHFLLASSKIWIFAESFCYATLNRARNHVKTR